MTSAENELLLQIAQSMQSMQVNMQSMQSTIQTMQSDIQGIKTDIQGMKTEINGMKTEINGMKTEINGMKTEIGGIKAEIGGIHRKLEEHDGRFDTIDANQKENDRKFNMIIEQVGKTAEDVTVIRLDVKEVREELKDMEQMRSMLLQHEFKIKRIS